MTLDRIIYQLSLRVKPLRYFLSACLSFLLWLAVGGYAVAASPEPEKAPFQSPSGEVWLERMVLAMQTQSYRGVYVYSRGGLSSSMKVIHRFKDGEDRERLIQLDGEMGEILRTGDEVICILPGNRVVSLEQSIPSGPFAGAFARTLMPKKEHYLITVEGEDRIAGYQTVKVAVMARDAYRYSYLLWLEKGSGLLLKSVLTGVDSEILEQFHYTSFEMADDISDAELGSSKMGDAYSHESVPSIQSTGDWPTKMKWRLDWLPDGFMPVNKGFSGTAIVSAGNVQAFTDGLASFSVFIEQPNSNSMPEGASIVGATVAYAHRLKWNEHEYMVTVVGEVPVTAAMNVAEKVVPDL